MNARGSPACNEENDVLQEFQFDGTYAGQRTSTLGNAPQRQPKRKGLWNSCFAPPPVKETHNASPSISQPSRLALTAKQLLYKRPRDGEPPQTFSLPLNDISDVQCKWIEAGGVRVSKVTVTSKSGRDPVVIRGLKNPRELVDAIERQWRASSARPAAHMGDEPQAQPVRAGGQAARTPQHEGIIREDPIPSSQAIPPTVSPGLDAAMRHLTPRQLFPDSPGSSAQRLPTSAAGSSCGAMTMMSPFARSPAQQFTGAATVARDLRLVSAHGNTRSNVGSPAAAVPPGEPAEAAVTAAHPAVERRPEAGLQQPPNVTLLSLEDFSQVPPPPPPVPTDSFTAPVMVPVGNTARGGTRTGPGTSTPREQDSSMMLHARGPSPITPMVYAAGSPPPSVDDSVMTGLHSQFTPVRSHPQLATAAASPANTRAGCLATEAASLQQSPLSGPHPQRHFSATPTSAAAGLTARPMAASQQPSAREQQQQHQEPPNGGTVTADAGGSGPRGSIPREEVRWQVEIEPFAEPLPVGALASEGRAPAEPPSSSHRHAAAIMPQPSVKAWATAAVSHTAADQIAGLAEQPQDELQLQPPRAPIGTGRVPYSSLPAPLIHLGSLALLPGPPRAASAASFKSAESSEPCENASAATTGTLHSRRNTETSEPTRPAAPEATSVAPAASTGVSPARPASGAPERKGVTTVGALGIAAAAATMSAVITSTASVGLSSVGLAAAPSIAAAGSVAASAQAATAAAAVSAATVAAPFTLMGLTVAAMMTVVAAAAVTHIRTGSPVRPLDLPRNYDVEEAEMLLRARKGGSMTAPHSLPPRPSGHSQSSGAVVEANTAAGERSRVHLVTGGSGNTARSASMGVGDTSFHEKGSIVAPLEASGPAVSVAPAHVGLQEVLSPGVVAVRLSGLDQRLAGPSGMAAGPDAGRSVCGTQQAGALGMGSEPRTHARPQWVGASADAHPITSRPAGSAAPECKDSGSAVRLSTGLSGEVPAEANMCQSHSLAADELQQAPPHGTLVMPTASGDQPLSHARLSEPLLERPAELVPVVHGGELRPLPRVQPERQPVAEAPLAAPVTASRRHHGRLWCQSPQDPTARQLFDGSDDGAAEPLAEDHTPREVVYAAVPYTRSSPGPQGTGDPALGRHGVSPARQGSSGPTADPPGWRRRHLQLSESPVRVLYSVHAAFTGLSSGRLLHQNFGAWGAPPTCESSVQTEVAAPAPVSECAVQTEEERRKSRSTTSSGAAEERSKGGQPSGTSSVYEAELAAADWSPGEDMAATGSDSGERTASRGSGSGDDLATVAPASAEDPAESSREQLPEHQARNTLAAANIVSRSSSSHSRSSRSAAERQARPLEESGLQQVFTLKGPEVRENGSEIAAGRPDAGEQWQAPAGPALAGAQDWYMSSMGGAGGNFSLGALGAAGEGTRPSMDGSPSNSCYHSPSHSRSCSSASSVRGARHWHAASVDSVRGEPPLVAAAARESRHLDALATAAGAGQDSTGLPYKDEHVPLLPGDVVLHSSAPFVGLPQLSGGNLDMAPTSGLATADSIQSEATGTPHAQLAGKNSPSKWGLSGESSSSNHTSSSASHSRVRGGSSSGDDADSPSSSSVLSDYAASFIGSGQYSPLRSQASHASADDDGDINMDAEVAINPAGSDSRDNTGVPDAYAGEPQRPGLMAARSVSRSNSTGTAPSTANGAEAGAQDEAEAHIATGSEADIEPSSCSSSAGPGGGLGGQEIQRRLLSPALGLSAEPLTPAVSFGRSQPAASKAGERDSSQELPATSSEETADDMVWLLGPPAGFTSQEGSQGASSAPGSPKIPPPPLQGQRPGDSAQFGSGSSTRALDSRCCGSRTGSRGGQERAAVTGQAHGSQRSLDTEESGAAAGRPDTEGCGSNAVTQSADEMAQPAAPGHGGLGAIAGGQSESSGGSGHASSSQTDGGSAFEPTAANLALFSAADAATAAAAATTSRVSSPDRRESSGHQTPKRARRDPGSATTSQTRPMSPDLSDISSAAFAGGYGNSSPRPSPFSPGTMALSPTLAGSPAVDYSIGTNTSVRGSATGSPGGGDMFHNPLYIIPDKDTLTLSATQPGGHRGSGAITLPMMPYTGGSTYQGLTAEDDAASSCTSLHDCGGLSYAASQPSVGSEGHVSGGRRRRGHQSPLRSPRHGSVTPRRLESESEAGEAASLDGRLRATPHGMDKDDVRDGPDDATAESGSGDGGSMESLPPHAVQPLKRARTRMPDAPLLLHSVASAPVVPVAAPAAGEDPARAAAAAVRRQCSDVAPPLASPMMVLNPTFATSDAGASSPRNGSDAGPGPVRAMSFQESRSSVVPSSAGEEEGEPAGMAVGAVAQVLAVWPGENHGTEAQARVRKVSAGSGMSIVKSSEYTTPKRLLQSSPLGWSSGGFQGSPSSQQAAHAAALLRHANEAVDFAREAVQRGDSHWLPCVTATLQAVQSALDALKEF